MADCGIANCGICCPGGCFCMDTGIGGCECWCDAVMMFQKPKGISGKVDAEMLIDFTATDMPILSLAKWLNFLFTDQIMLPVSIANKQVTTGLIKQIKLGDLVAHLGLVAERHELVGRDFTNFAHA